MSSIYLLARRAPERGRILKSIEWTNHEPANLVAVAHEWDRLVLAEGYPPFMQADFIAAAVDHFGCRDGQLVLGRAGGTLCAGALLQRIGFGRWQTFQPSQMPLGASLFGRDHRSDLILRGLCRTLPGLKLELSITQVDPLYTPRSASTAGLETMDYVSTSWITVAGSYEEFWNSRGKNLRQNLGKQRRKLEEQGQLKFEYLDGSEAVERAFLDFAQIESQGWKSAGGTAIALENSQGHFYRDVLQRFASSGNAFALRLSLDDVVLAVDFGLRNQAMAVILKTTYNETYKSFSPAQLLHQQAFEHFFSQGPERIEFYGKVMEWHTRWTEQRRMLYHLNYFPHPVVGRLRSLVRG